MALVPVLSLHVSACPPSRALERAHPAHPRYYYNKYCFHSELVLLQQPLHLQGGDRAAQSTCCKEAVSSNTHTHLDTEIQVVPSA